MSFRVPAPDGKKGKDGLPVRVLPAETVLRDSYRVSYHTMGGMCIAYKGLREGKQYFIKEVEGSDSRRVIVLSQEKATLERLNHPGIIKAYDFFEQDGFYYLVLDFIEGESLDKLISPIPGVFIQDKVISSWASQLYEIFEYLHHQTPPIIYRDLKPQNVIRDGDGRVHLVDFGIARVYKEAKSEDTERMGTALTASPEHYGGKQTDARSDVYTMGATLHFLLTNGKGQSDSLFEFLPVSEINLRVSKDLEKVIMKAVEIDPEDRFQSIAEMREAHIAAGQYKSCEAPGSAETKNQPAKSEPVPEKTGGEITDEKKIEDSPKTGETLPRKAALPVPLIAILLISIMMMITGILVIQKFVKPASVSVTPAQSSDDESSDTEDQGQAVVNENPTVTQSVVITVTATPEPTLRERPTPLAPGDQSASIHPSSAAPTPQFSVATQIPSGMPRQVNDPPPLATTPQKQNPARVTETNIPDAGHSTEVAIREGSFNVLVPYGFYPNDEQQVRNPGKDSHVIETHMFRKGEQNVTPLGFLRITVYGFNEGTTLEKAWEFRKEHLSKRAKDIEFIEFSDYRETKLVNLDGIKALEYDYTIYKEEKNAYVLAREVLFGNPDRSRIFILSAQANKRYLGQFVEDFKFFLDSPHQ